MGKSDSWGMIHAERKALVADLEALSDEQWTTASQCSGWTVQDVVGHMASTAKITPPTFFAGFVGSGFNFDRFTAKAVHRETQGTPADTLASFKSRLTATTHPPGPVQAMVGEAIIHGEDIRRPLEIKREYPQESVVAVADFYKNSNLIVGAKRRISGLQLRATDSDWSNGSGPEVSGPILSLVLAMTGRKDALADLSGEGIATLASRP